MFATCTHAYILGNSVKCNFFFTVNCKRLWNSLFRRGVLLVLLFRWIGVISRSNVIFSVPAATSALSTGGCDRRTQRGWEELPHIGGQGQKPGRPHARRAAAKRSYPTSKVRGGGWEGLPHAPTPEARGGSREDQLHAQGAVAEWAQEGLEELSPHWRSGRAAVRRYPCPR